MKISKQSMFYRFLTDNFVTEEWHVPRNLCPFMRKVLLGILATAFAYSMIAVAILSVIAFPLALLGAFDIWEPIWRAYLVALGAVLYGLASIVGAIWAFSAAEKRYHVVGKTAENVCGLHSVQTSVKYIKSMHDKVCPSIEFTDEPLP